MERRPHTPYTEEQRRFLKDNVQGRSYQELADLFNQRFGCSVGRLTISNVCRRLGLSNGKPERRPYSNEQISFLRENAEGKHYEELSKLFDERFGTATNAKIVGELCRRHGFSNGLDCRYAEGHTVNLGRKFDNALPDGSEYVNSMGYIIMKQDGVWKTKQSAIWEEVYGEIPPGHHVVFGDGNRRNFDIDNLFCIPASQACIRTNMGLKGDTPELAQLGVTLAALYDTIGKRTKRNNRK